MPDFSDERILCNDSYATNNEAQWSFIFWTDKIMNPFPDISYEEFVMYSHLSGKTVQKRIPSWSNKDAWVNFVQFSNLKPLKDPFYHFYALISKFS